MGCKPTLLTAVGWRVAPGVGAERLKNSDSNIGNDLEPARIAASTQI
jgi:hypothetical protein